LRGKGQRKLKLSRNGNECKPLRGGGDGGGGGGVAQVSAGSRHSVAVMDSGALYSWVGRCSLTLSNPS
jgi:hypothetical protein